jgi:hypothetical protein
MKTIDISEKHEKTTLMPNNLQIFFSMKDHALIAV